MNIGFLIILINGLGSLYSLLKNHSEKIIDFPEILGIHIYNNKKGKVLQFDIEGVVNGPA